MSASEDRPNALDYTRTQIFPSWHNGEVQERTSQNEWLSQRENAISASTLNVKAYYHHGPPVKKQGKGRGQGGKGKWEICFFLVYFFFLYYLFNLSTLAFCSITFSKKIEILIFLCLSLILIILTVL